MNLRAKEEAYEERQEFFLQYLLYLLLAFLFLTFF